MADLNRVAQETAKLIDALEAGIGEDDEIGDLLLIAEVVSPETTDRAEASYLQYHCSTGRYVVQQGLIAWANSAMASDARREAADEEDE